MHEKGKGRVFLWGLGLCVTLVLSAPDRVRGDVPVENINQGRLVGHQLALKAPLIEESDTQGKAEGPPPREEKKTVPSTVKERPTARDKTDPLKKFVPSEKIPADQAVDFPADI